MLYFPFSIRNEFLLCFALVLDFFLLLVNFSSHEEIQNIVKIVEKCFLSSSFLRKYSFTESKAPEYLFYILQDVLLGWYTSRFLSFRSSSLPLNAWMKLNYRRSVEVNCVNSSELFFTFEEWKQIDKNIDKEKQFCGSFSFFLPPVDKMKSMTKRITVKLSLQEISHHRQLIHEREVKIVGDWRKKKEFKRNLNLGWMVQIMVI